MFNTSPKQRRKENKMQSNGKKREHSSARACARLFCRIWFVSTWVNSLSSLLHIFFAIYSQTNHFAAAEQAFYSHLMQETS